MKMAKNSWKLAASTILLNTDHRVMMLCRGASAPFMPNSFVFPGGVLSPSADDHFPFFDERTNNVFVRAKTKEEEFRSLPKLITLGLASDHALRVCALRELFEESGLLPVILSPAGKTPSTADETPPHSQTAAKRILLNSGDDPKLHEWRLRVRDDATRFSELFSASSSYALQIPGNHLKNSIPKLDLSSLIPFSNWLTPHLGHKRRYDTVLFVLPLNLKSLPKAEPCDREMTSEVIWAEPREIVHRSHSGAISIPPPQYYELRRLEWALTGLQQLKLQQLCWRLSNPTRITPLLVPLIEEEDLPKSDENEPKNGGGSQNVVGLLPGDHLYDQEEADHPNPDDPYSQRLAAKLFAAAEGTEAHKDSKETDANKKPIHRLYFTLCPSAGTFTNLRLQISGVTR